MFVLLLVFVTLSVSAEGLADYPIKHWIVMMFENRSFDHLLGHLHLKNPNVDGLTGKETNPYNPFNPNSKLVQVNFNAGPIDPNAGHSVDSTTIEVFGGANMTHLNPAPMNGFVADAESLTPGWGPLVMSTFNDKTLPVLSTLAEEFGVFDHWHASIPGPTEVNRAFLFSATSNGYATNDYEELALGFPQKTIFQQFDDVGKDWKVFFEFFPTTLFMRQLRDRPENFHSLLDFGDLCASGNLPTFSFLEPRYYEETSEFPANDQHPAHDITEGEKIIKWVYETLRASPVWNNSAFLVVYDEHGGYYDHVPTPLDGVPNPDGKVSTNPPFDFKRSGVRIPAVVASPWINKNTVVKTPTGPTPTSQYEHSSLGATMKKIYGFTDFLTERQKWSGTFESIFLDRSAPRTDCPTTLPNPPVPFKKSSGGEKKMHSLQRNMVAAAAALNGLTMDDVKNLGIVTEKQGGRFAEDQLRSYFEEKGYKVSDKYLKL